MHDSMNLYMHIHGYGGPTKSPKTILRKCKNKKKIKKKGLGRAKQGSRVPHLLRPQGIVIEAKYKHTHILALDQPYATWLSALLTALLYSFFFYLPFFYYEKKKKLYNADPYNYPKPVLAVYVQCIVCSVVQTKKIIMG